MIRIFQKKYSKELKCPYCKKNINIISYDRYPEVIKVENLIQKECNECQSKIFVLSDLFECEQCGKFFCSNCSRRLLSKQDGKLICEDCELFSKKKIKKKFSYFLN